MMLVSSEWHKNVYKWLISAKPIYTLRLGHKCNTINYHNIGQDQSSNVNSPQNNPIYIECSVFSGNHLWDTDVC